MNSIFALFNQLPPAAQSAVGTIIQSLASANRDRNFLNEPTIWTEEFVRTARFYDLVREAIRTMPLVLNFYGGHAAFRNIVNRFCEINGITDEVFAIPRARFVPQQRRHVYRLSRVRHAIAFALNWLQFNEEGFASMVVNENGMWHLTVACQETPEAFCMDDEFINRVHARRNRVVHGSRNRIVGRRGRPTIIRRAEGADQREDTPASSRPSSESERVRG